MRYLILLVLFAIGILAAEETGPTELPPLALRAISTHERAVTTAQEDFVKKVERADEALIRALDGEMKKAVSAGRQDQAVAIRTKIEEIGARDKKMHPFIDGTISAGGVGNKDAGDLTVGKEVVLNAAVPFTIGAVKAGDRISVQYVRGVWSYRGGNMNSPDGPKVDVKYRVAIFDKLPDGWGKLAIVDGDTTAKVWTYEFISDKADVRLGINDNPNDTDNVGEVVYMVMLQRKS